jgi:cell wall-associated NlpC family hydrolase
MTEHGRSAWKVFLGAALAATLFLWGCAKAPRRPRVAPPPPPPRLERTPQEMALQQAMRKFYGAPYRYGGTTPAGVDCSGLVLAVYQPLGIAVPRTAADQFTAGQPVPLNRLRFGDVVFFNRYCYRKEKVAYMASMFPPEHLSEVCHAGIYLGDGRFIHASSNRGVEISSLNDDAWRRSLVGARRFLLGPRAENP